ncbi:beta-1,3-galactosyltransferase 5-like [Dermatophagoides pteronyssinus]|uniref:Hexosyltransferase n=1 Tax=Dermatophagoides pteronyssinus TaxID=6956 RepID=A0ABQ8JQK0_DERPT|nr:hypothetical protein DERP_009106 [Dermatophagoides pteronyssinus]
MFLFIFWIIKRLVTAKNQECQLNYHNHKIYNHIVQYPFKVKSCYIHTDLIILVHSSLDHFNHRQTIRKFLQTNKNWSIVFILGQPSINNKTLENKINYESNLNGDILRMEFVDSYRNLTLKHLSGLWWLIKHCHHDNILNDETIWILKMDDDIFIDEILLKKFLKHLSQLNESENQIYCYRMDNTSPLRDQKSKWYVSNTEYSYNLYPSYCSGWAYLTTIDTIKKLLCPLNHMDLFWIDDVFVTGILRQHTDINLVAINHLFNLNIQILYRWLEYHGQTKWFYLFSQTNNDWYAMQKAYRQRKFLL